jgi:uncharacterized membrane protein
MSGAAPRRTYLDVMRGIAVLVMIEAHVIDSWTRTGDRGTKAFGYSLILGGFGAPLFLFLAGVAVSLSAGSKTRRTGDHWTAARAVERRGLEIFALAFLFRLQSFVISRSSPVKLLTVDILNIMGPAIAAIALLWGACRTDRQRVTALTAATAGLAFLTPAVRAAAWLAPLPDFIEGYIRPVAGISNFAVFPWAAFVAAGAVAGVLIDRCRTGSDEARTNLGFAAGGAALAAIAYAASFRPPVFAASSFWTSSPAFFFMRVGILVCAVALAYGWERRPRAGQRFSPLQMLGRHSLFIYWIHVEMVYGGLSIPLHHALSLRNAWVAYGAFSALMLLCALSFDRFQTWRRGLQIRDSTARPTQRIAQPT